MTTFDLYGEGTCTIEELLDVTAHNLAPIYMAMNHIWGGNLVPNEAEIRTVLDSLWRDLKEAIRYSKEEVDGEFEVPGFIATGGITMVPSFDEHGELDDLKIFYELGSRWAVSKARGYGFTK